MDENAIKHKTFTCVTFSGKYFRIERIVHMFVSSVVVMENNHLTEVLFYIVYNEFNQNILKYVGENENYSMIYMPYI